MPLCLTQRLFATLAILGVGSRERICRHLEVVSSIIEGNFDRRQRCHGRMVCLLLRLNGICIKPKSRPTGEEFFCCLINEIGKASLRSPPVGRGDQFTLFVGPAAYHSASVECSLARPLTKLVQRPQRYDSLLVRSIDTPPGGQFG
jgi:hypothetical protein